MATLLQRSIGGFTVPRDIAIRPDAARLAVAESTLHRLRLANLPAAAAFTTFGAYGTQGAALAFPEAVAFDSAGNLFVLDLWNQRVVRFLVQGNSYIYDPSFSPAAGLGHARDMALDAAGVLFVLDGDNDRIVRIDPAITTIPLPTGLRSPWGLALRAGGGFLVCDRDGHRVIALTLTGTLQFEIGSFGRGNGQLRFPEHVAIAPSGSIWVADTDNNRIQEFTASGAFVRVVIATQQFRQIRRLRFAPNATLFVVDPGAGVVHEVSDAVPARGLHVSRTQVDFGQLSVGSASDSTLTLANVGSGAVHVQSVATSGAPFSIPTGMGTPFSIASGASRTVRVSFAPISPGPVSGFVEIASDATQNLRTVRLGGSAVLVPDVSVGVVIDVSRTMNGRFREIVKLEQLKELLGQFPLLPPGPRDGQFLLGAVIFNQAAEVLLPLRSLDRGKLAGVLGKIPPGEGQPSLGAGIEAGLAMLEGSPGRRTLIVFTAGGSDIGGAIEDIKLPDGVTLHMIGLCDASELDVARLMALTRRTGGSFHLTGSDPGALPRVLAQVSADMLDHDLMTTREISFAAEQKEIRIPLRLVGSDRRLGFIGTASALGAPLSAQFVPDKKNPSATTLVVRRGKGWKHEGDVSVSIAIGVESDLRLRVALLPPLLQRARHDGSAVGDAPELRLAVGDKLEVGVRLTERGVPIDGAKGSASALLLRDGVGGLPLRRGRSRTDPDPIGVDSPRPRAILASQVATRKAPTPSEFGIAPSPFPGDPGLPGSIDMRGTAGPAKSAGVYVIRTQVRVRAVDGGEATRERLTSAYVSPELDARASDVKLTPLSDDRIGTWRLHIVPRDRFGTPLGPGWAQELTLAGDGVVVLGGVNDRGDGSYSIDVTANAGDGQPGALVLQLGPSWVRLHLPARGEVQQGAP